MWHLLVLMMVQITLSQGSKITCYAPAVRKGEPANITCQFNEDVSVTKKNVKVQHMPYSAANTDLDYVNTVVDCYWLNSEEFKCNLGDGFKLFGGVGRTATLGITMAADHFTGKYMCEIVPSEPGDILPCDFHLREDPEPDCDSCPQQSSGRTTPDVIASLTLAAVVIVIALVVILIVLVLFKDRLEQIFRNCASPMAKNSSKTTADGTSPSEESTEHEGLLGLTTDPLLKNRAAEASGQNPNKILIEIPIEKELHLTLDEKIGRGQDEVRRRLQEDDTQAKLEEIRRENDEARRRQEEDDRKNNVKARDLKKKEKERRQQEEERMRGMEKRAYAMLIKIKTDNETERHELKRNDFARLQELGQHTQTQNTE